MHTYSPTQGLRQPRLRIDSHSHARTHTHTHTHTHGAQTSLSLFLHASPLHCLPGDRLISSMLHSFIKPVFYTQAHKIRSLFRRGQVQTRSNRKENHNYRCCKILSYNAIFHNNSCLTFANVSITTILYYYFGPAFCVRTNYNNNNLYNQMLLTTIQQSFNTLH